MRAKKIPALKLVSGYTWLIFASCLIASGFTVPTYAQLDGNCGGSLQNGYGPYDYTNATDRRDKLRVVENAHYDRGVQSLNGNIRTPGASVASDLDYVLRAFPNHHKALYTLIKYDLSDDPRHKRRLRYSTSCYFERASAWRPQDGKVQLLWGIYLAKTKQLELAKAKFAEAERLNPESSEVHYNIGLMMAKGQDYEAARRHAKMAYGMGYPMPGLRNILMRAGEWDETKP